MSVIYVLIPLAIIIISIAIGIFFWAVKSNQFDDLERHGHSILYDDDIKQPDVVNAKPCQSDPQSASQNKTQNESMSSDPACKDSKD